MVWLDKWATKHLKIDIERNWEREMQAVKKVTFVSSLPLVKIHIVHWEYT